MSRINLNQYQTLVFDCDGVLLNSNKIKTQAFYDVAKVYSHEPAQKLKDYHLQNGGISRHKKFEYLLTSILKKPIETQELSELLTNFSKEVKKGLLTCEIAKNIKELRKKTKNSTWLVVSGGDQSELREVFKKRGLEEHFDGGIFGSPDDKDTILINEIDRFNIKGKSLFLGDSLYDYQAATKAKMDFVFLSRWSDVPNLKEKFIGRDFLDLSELCNIT